MYVLFLYSGLKCEGDVHDCLSSPCQHGGRCSERTSGEPGFDCECISPWDGVTCELDSRGCEVQPCIHGECSETLSGGKTTWKNKRI